MHVSCFCKYLRYSLFLFQFNLITLCAGVYLLPVDQKKICNVYDSFFCFPVDRLNVLFHLGCFFFIQQSSDEGQVRSNRIVVDLLISGLNEISARINCSWYISANISRKIKRDFQDSLQRKVISKCLLICQKFISHISF